VARSKAADFYRRADVFLFPTHSDGFGMTQLEAQAWKLPVIASRNGGEVVRDGENGILLPRVTPVAITEAIREMIGDPLRLARFSDYAVGVDQFGLDRLGHSLTSLFDGR
jgi:glycosyltransferase involved in cell wall biosynthesis